MDKHADINRMYRTSIKEIITQYRLLSNRSCFRKSKQLIWKTTCKHATNSQKKISAQYGAQNRDQGKNKNH